MVTEQMDASADKDALHEWVNDLSAKMKTAQQAAAHYEQLYLLERARNEVWELKEECRQLRAQLDAVRKAYKIREAHDGL